MEILSSAEERLIINNKKKNKYNNVADDDNTIQYLYEEEEQKICISLLLSTHFDMFKVLFFISKDTSGWINVFPPKKTYSLN